VLLSQISAKTGLALEAGPAMRQEVVCLFVKDAPVATVLAKLAEVTGGEWRESGGVKRLFPSPTVERREKQERAAQIAENARTTLKTEHVKIDRIRTLDEKAIRPLVDLSQKAMASSSLRNGEDAFTKEFEAKDPGEPSERLLVRLLDLIPLSEWTELPNGARVVYSSNATAMQRPLPVLAGEEIRKFAGEHQTWTRLMAPIYAKVMEELVRELEKNGEERDMTPPLPAQLPERYKVNVIIQMDAYSRGASASLSVRDLKGKEVESSSLSFGSNRDGDEEAAEPPQTATPPAALLSLSADTLDFAKMQTTRNIQLIDATLEARISRWRPFALDPAANEPMSPFGQLWIDLAKEKHVNLIGYVDDLMAQGIPPKPVSADDLLARIAEVNTVAKGDGWLTIRPKEFSEARKYRIDRELAARLYPAALRTNGLTIGDAADYTASIGSPLGLSWSNWDGGQLAFLLWANGIPRPRLFMSTSLVMYGMLSPTERQTLHSRPLMFSELPNKAQQLLAQNLYWPEDGESSDGQEPTDVFPTGLPAAGTIRISAEGSEQVVVPMIHAGSREVPATTARSAAQFGKMLAGVMGSEPQRKAAVTFQGYRRFRVATGNWIDIEIAFSPTWKATERLYELICPPSSIVSYDDLSSTFKAEVEAARQKAIAEFRSNPPVTTEPPPP